MGRWIEADPDATLGRAGQYYRQAIAGEPDNASATGPTTPAYLLNAGRLRTGRAALRPRVPPRGPRRGHRRPQRARPCCDAGLGDEARPAAALRARLFSTHATAASPPCGSSTSSSSSGLSNRPAPMRLTCPPVPAACCCRFCVRKSTARSSASTAASPIPRAPTLPSLPRYASAEEVALGTAGPGKKLFQCKAAG